MPDPQFILWGTTYVIVKWTIGAWAIRRVRAALAARTSAEPSDFG